MRPFGTPSTSTCKRYDSAPVPGIDVDEIIEVDYLDASTSGEEESVQVTFKNGMTKTYEGSELPGLLAILNHWTPPTA